MLHIYYIDDPKPLSENLYPEALKIGEMRQLDLHNIFDDLGIGTYTGHYTNLAQRLRLIDEVINNQYYILSEQTAGAIRQTDSGKQLFDVLTRLPHFARWVQLTQGNDDENVDYNDVVPWGARQYKMRRQRVGQFESWAEEITEIAGDTTFDALQSEFERQSAYIWEDYISFDGIQTYLDPVVLLVLLGGAANVDASCKSSRLLDILPCDRGEFDTIVDDVLTPVGVPLYRTSSCIGLDLPTELQVDNLTKLWDQISKLFDDDDVDISSLDDLTDYLQFKTNILDFVDAPEDSSPRFTVMDESDDSGIPSREGNEEFTTKVDVPQPVENAAFVALPPTTAELTSQDFFAEIERPLKVIADGEEAIHKKPRFEYHVREQWYHLGSIPLLKAPDFDTLTTLGEHYLQQNIIARRKLVFDHLLARNPPVRTIIAAADVNRFRMEHAGESWVIRTDHDEVRVHAVLEELTDHDELTMIGIDSKDPVAQIISYLCTAGILKGQGTVNQLQISSSIHEHLKQNTRGSRQLLEQAKDRVQSMVGGLQ